MVRLGVVVIFAASRRPVHPKQQTGIAQPYKTFAAYNFGDLKFGIITLDHQIAKSNSTPIFPAIRYLIKLIRANP